jgi:hypothetical protein
MTAIEGDKNNRRKEFTMTQWDGSKGLFFSSEKLKKLEEICSEPIWMLKDDPNEAVTDAHFSNPGHPKFKKVTREYAKKVMSRENYERMLSCGYSRD